MSILERMKNLIAQKAQTSVAKWQSSTMFVVSGGSNGEGKRQTFSPYAAAMSYRSWIYAAANLNAVAVASVPLRLYVRNRSTGTKLWRTQSPSRRTKAFLSGDRDQRPSNYVLRKAAEYGSDFEVVTDTHPILELLAKVNPYQNGYDATVLRVLYTELTGNAYIHPVLDPATKRPVQLWTMPSQFVEIIPGKERFIEAYLYGSSREQRKIFAPDEVIHFKRPNPNDLYYGIGKVEAAWSAVQMNAAVHEMDLSFFENKARPDYLMTIRGDASHDEIERLEAQIDEKLRGARRTGRFLTATADIDIKPLSFPPKDLAGRDSIVEEIAAIFGVPVSMLKANDPNLANAKQGYETWRESTILPMLRMDEETLNQNLLPLFGIEDDAFLAYDNPVSGDRRLELEEIRTAVSGGWMTVNEARAAEGMEPLDDEFADRALINGQPLGGMAALPPAPPAPMAPEPTENVPVEPIAKAEVDDCVSSKIPKLIDEGYPQDQAIAIAYSMCAEGKSASEAAISLGLSTKSFDVDDVEMKALGDIDTTPPKTVAENARRALEVRASKPESQRGMTAVGIARARDLANRKPLSEDTIRRMLSYFERHEVDKQGSTWDDQGKGWQAWYGWGGDDGFAWSRRKVDEFDRERERNGKTISKSCGCHGDEPTSLSESEMWRKALEDCELEDENICSKNCGVGPEGFEEGNTCGGSSGGGGSSGSGSSESESKPASSEKPKKPSSSEKPKKPSKPRSGGKPPKGSAPSPSMEKPKEHNVKLPANPRRLNIDEADLALRQMGYTTGKLEFRNGNTYKDLIDSRGNKVNIPISEITNFIYANSNDPEDNARPAIRPRKSKKCFEVDESEREKSCGCCSKNGGNDPPAKPSERITGSDRNPEGSASGSRGGIEISEATEETLRNKVDEHNKEHGDSDSKKVDLGMLKAVYRRGAGAFSTSHRTGVGREQWAIARVNAFLYLVRNGKPEDADYTNDFDLLPDGHPKKPKKKTIRQSDLWNDLPEITVPYRIRRKASRDDAEREMERILEEEQEIGRSVDRVLRRQVDAVLKELRASTAPTAELTVKVEEILRSSKWDRQLVEALRPYLLSSLENGIAVGVDAVKEVAKAAPDFWPSREELEAYTRSESVRLARGAARGVNRYTVVRFSEIIGTGVQDGKTIPEIASDVQEWAGEKGDAERATRSRALMIARTEAQRASRKAEVEAWKATGIVEGKVWLLAPDPCEFCEAASDAFSKNQIGLEDSFYQKGSVLTGADGGELSLDYEDIEGPPLHPNCRCSLQPRLISDYEEIIASGREEIANLGAFEEPEEETE